MQTINFDIAQLLKKAKSGHFLIPQFQREFTWKPGQTKLLIDSIARNYPIGSLLILGKNDEVPLSSRRLAATYPTRIVESVESDGCSKEDVGAESFYVLDGQQRLTSIVRVFLDAHPVRNYYFDLKKMSEVFDQENEAWVVSRVRGQKNPDRKDNNRLIRADVAMDQAVSDVYIAEYIEDSGDFPEFEQDRAGARRLAAKIKGIFETIRKFSIPFVVLDNDAPLESVCRVFETINSTGTRLTTFDLAVARYYPSPDLKALYYSAQEEHPILSGFEIDGERVLQVLSLFHLRNTNKFPEAKRSTLLSLEPRFLEENWSVAASHLAEACTWISKLGPTTSRPPHGIVVSIAAALMTFPGSLSKPEFPGTLRKWYFCSTLAKDLAVANNYKIGDDFRRFCDFLADGTPLVYPRVFFTNEQICEIKHRSDRRYGAIQALMGTTLRDDLITGNPFDGELEDHHIFPYSLRKSGVNYQLLNSVANRILLSKSSNRHLLDNYPDGYLTAIVERHRSEGSLSELDRRFKDALIPYSCLDEQFSEKISPRSFETFLRDRATEIINRIQAVVGDAWSEVDTE